MDAIREIYEPWDVFPSFGKDVGSLRKDSNPPISLSDHFGLGLNRYFGFFW